MDTTPFSDSCVTFRPGDCRKLFLSEFYSDDSNRERATLARIGSDRTFTCCFLAGLSDNMGFIEDDTVEDATVHTASSSSMLFVVKRDDSGLKGLRTNKIQ